MTRAQVEDFFVGYLPMPRGERGFLRLLVPTVLWGLCALAALIAWRMASAGTGAWDLSKVVELRGRLVAAPYPAVMVGEEMVLLVEEGKMPVRSGLDGLIGRDIAACGTVLARNGRRMLEMLPAEEGLRVEGAESSIAPLSVDAQPVRSAIEVGEMLDLKCFQGAMKPGEGVTHRGCAALCVQGGIPPGLVVRDQKGNERVYLLAAEDGSRWNAAALPHVGHIVRVRGMEWRVGGWDVLRVSSVE